KKMIDDPKKPGVVEETFERLKILEEENTKLRNKIADNIKLISRTEEVVKKTIDENTRLKEEIKKGSVGDVNEVSNLQKKNLDLSNRIKSLISSLTEKDNVISVKDNEITIKNNELNIKETDIAELKLKLDEAQSALEFMANTAPEDNPEVSKEIIEELKSELSIKNSQLVELENSIQGLNSKITELNEKLIESEAKASAESLKPQVIRPKPSQTSSSTLEMLCQDLQADLNKYKRIVDDLNKEKSNLKEKLESGGFKLEPEDITILKNENESLKAELTQLQEDLQEKTKTTPDTLSLVESERLIEDLKEQLKLKDKLIDEMKPSAPPQAIPPKGPMSSLVKELQNNINKLKIALEEKNNIIEKLKSS
ncbi:MAG: hypothetical protein ACXAB8_10430, partial [Promethearchaeota archaeon]